MDWTQFWSTLAVLGVFSVFITSIIQVIKGISALGVSGVIRGLIPTLTKNKPMPAESFPVLNFAISLLFCWIFHVGVISIFTRAINIAPGTALPPISGFLDYFGTASVVYLGADQLFKKFLDVANDEKNAIIHTESMKVESIKTNTESS
jgi:hypothetical protein